MLLRWKFPVVKQYDQADCAPATLLSILKYYGGNSSIVYLRELCNTTNRGTTMMNLVSAARQIGFEAQGVTGSYEDLIKQQFPCIAHIHLDNGIQHFVVLYKVNKTQIIIGDPATGLRKIPIAEFQRTWKHRFAVLLQPGKHVFQGKNPRWYEWIAKYLKIEKVWIYQTLFLGGIYTGLSLVLSYFIHLIIDRFIPLRDLTGLGYTAVLLFFLLIIRALAGFARHRFSVELNKRVGLHINTAFIGHLFKLPKKFFDTHKTGDITARIHDTIRIQQAILNITGYALIDILIITGSTLFTFFFSLHFGLTAVIAIPIYGMILWKSSSQLKFQQREVMKNFALVESTYINSLSGIDDIMNFNSADSFIRLNKFTFRGYQEKIKELGWIRANLNFSAELAGSIFTLIILFMGTYLVITDSLLLGEMMASYSLAIGILAPIGRLVDTNISLMGASVASQRLLDLLLVPIADNKQGGSFVLENSITIHNASYHWSGGENLFCGLNLEIKKGRITALMGKSGAGKSTLVQLLQKKYNLDKGKILIDQTPVIEINTNELRNQIGVVPQDINIFNGSLAENILCGREAGLADEFSRKVQKLGFEPFIESFPSGYATRLGEDGQQISGGEKQLLGLLRALYDEPVLLIIDEGFSAIDQDMQFFMFSLLKKYAENHAILLISHNPQILFWSDYVYMFRDKKITVHGKPEELDNFVSGQKNQFDFYNLHTLKDLK